jgi:DNA-binding transcriptional LysR family regulator
MRPGDAANNLAFSELIVRYYRTMISSRDLPLLPVFVAVVRAGSFTEAARTLGLSKSVVSQHVRTLEERCGVRLMERSTRRLRLTQIGEQVFDAAQEVQGAVHALEQIVERGRAEPTGTLRVTLPLDPSLSRLVSSVAAKLTRHHPELKIDLVLEDAVRDLVADGLDVAIRLGTLTPSSYVLRRLGSEPEIVVADPARAEEIGRDAGPDKLRNLPWIVHTALGTRPTRTLVGPGGKKVQVPVNALVTTNTVVSLRDLLLQGVGVAIAPLHVVREDISRGQLVRICPAWYHRKLWLYALLPTRKNPPRVRVFLVALLNEAQALGFQA